MNIQNIHDAQLDMPSKQCSNFNDQTTFMRLSTEQVLNESQPFIKITRMFTIPYSTL